MVSSGNLTGNDGKKLKEKLEIASEVKIFYVVGEHQDKDHLEVRVD